MNEQILIYASGDPDNRFLIGSGMRRTAPDITFKAFGTSRDVIDDLAEESNYNEFEDRRAGIVLLLDWDLPPNGALQTIAELRQRSGSATVPVVLLTSDIHQEEIDAAYEAGASSVIEKDLSVEGLARTIELVVGFWLGANKSPTIISRHAVAT